MSPEEQKDVAAIERFLGRTMPRVMLPDFDYGMKPAEIRQAVSYRDGRPAAPPAPGGARRSAAVTPGHAHARPSAAGARPIGIVIPRAEAGRVATVPADASASHGRRPTKIKPTDRRGGKRR